MKKLIFLSLASVLAIMVSGATLTTTFTSAPPTPPQGTLEYVGNAYKASNVDSSKGYKLSSTNNGVAWKLGDTNIKFSAASVQGFVNTSSGGDIGYSFSTDGGSTWGTAYTFKDDGKKTPTTSYTLSNVPDGANAIKIIRAAGTTTYLYAITITYDDGPSKDATLSAITFDGNALAGFSASSLDYNVTLPADYSGLPEVSATAKDSKAKVSTTQVESLPGKATIEVTAEDGKTKKVYTITFMKESTAPLVTTAKWDNITAAGATIDQINYTITGKVKNGTSLTAIQPTFTGKYIQSWTPTDPQDFTGGPIDYTFTSPSQEKTIYHVTITEADPISDDATLKLLSVEGSTLTPSFSPNTFAYQAGVSDATVPKTTAEANHPAAKVQITPATSVTGATVVTVTAEDGVTTKEYRITYKTVVPSTTLTLHTPGTYEEKTLAGGYETPLTVINGREYEVYYAGRDANSSLTITTTPAIKTDGICSERSSSGCKAQDGWFEVSEPLSSPSTYTVPAMDEFVEGSSAIHKIQGGSYKLHVKGFDQFSFLGMDNNTDKSKGKYIEVRIDNILQDMTLSTTASIRRFDISTDEHVIELKGLGQSNDQVIAFSLRIAQEPRLKWIKGNDSTQVVYQTLAPKPIYYFTKYNSKGHTDLIWDGPEATGITLTKGNSSAIGDTLMIGGTAQCPVGVYNFHVAAFNAQGSETSRSEGKITVASKISAQTDTIIDAYTGEAIDEIKFKYYALSGDDVKIEWQPSAPDGITTTANNGIFTIGGSPTQTGTFTYMVSVKDGNSIPGKITIRVLDLGNDPVLYLYKNNLAYEKDGIYTYLTSKGKNLIARKAKSELRTPDQYEKYKWCIISEDVDANNPEVMALARGDVKMIVLNMKSFSYSPSRLDWGEPDNGSLNNRDVVVTQPTHPIFQTFGARFGDKINVLDTVTTKGMMPAMVDYQGTLCLATATTRGEDYYGDGVQETFLHEVPASMRQGAKYICFPLAMTSSANLSSNGKKLLDACVTYLLGTAPTIALPELKITSFSVNGQAAIIDQTKNTIRLTMPKGTDLTTLIPTIQLSNSTTHVTPASGEAIDFTDQYYGVNFIVSDYINIRVYNAIISIERTDGIDEVYEDGEWVTIYDISGREITTTNENVYNMPLPRGIYLIQTTRGSFKIMK